MIVNFASGTHPFPMPWWNVDLNDHMGVNERVDLLDEFPPTLVDVSLAYVGHFLEHLLPEEAVAFLGRVRAVMRPGGRIVVVGPDIRRAEKLHTAGELGDDLLAAVRPHGFRVGNDVSHIHEWHSSAARVRAMLTTAGFLDPGAIAWDEFPALDIPVISDARWQFALTAHTGATP